MKNKYRIQVLQDSFAERFILLSVEFINMIKYESSKGTLYTKNCSGSITTTYKRIINK